MPAGAPPTLRKPRSRQPHYRDPGVRPLTIFGASVASLGEAFAVKFIRSRQRWGSAATAVAAHWPASYLVAGSGH